MYVNPISFSVAQDKKRTVHHRWAVSFFGYGEFETAASGGGRWIEQGCAAGGGCSSPVRSAAVEKPEDQRKPERFFGHRKADRILPPQPYRVDVTDFSYIHLFFMPVFVEIRSYLWYYSTKAKRNVFLARITCPINEA